MSPDWPKRSTPRATTRWRATAPSQESVAGWPSRTVTRAAPGQRAFSKVSTCERPSGASALRVGGGQPIRVEPAGRSHHQQPGLGDILANQGVRLDGLGRDDAGTDNRQSRPGPRGNQPVTAADDGGSQFGGQRALWLVHRPGREAEVNRTAVIVLDMPQGPRNNHGQLVHEGGLERRHPGLADADQRRDHRLVRLPPEPG